MPTFPTFIQYIFGFLATAITQEQEIKVIQIREEEVKLSPFADDRILYLKEPKYSTKNSYRS
jgi:hypothetical protein